MFNFISENKELKQKLKNLEDENKKLLEENTAEKELLSLILNNDKLHSIINSFKIGEAFIEPIEISSYVDYDIASYFPLLKKMGYKITDKEIQLIKELVETHDKLRNLKK